jgi:DNA-binding NarL/FixJ family response regulator
LGIFKIFEEDYALDFGNVFGNEEEIVNDLSQLSDVGREIILKHYGVKRKSGRYPWDPSLHLPKNYKFIEDRDEMKKRGLSDNEIAKQMGLSTTVYRSKVTIAKEELKQYNMQRISKLQSEGMIIDDIAKTIGTTGQTVRNYLDEIKNPNKSARAQRVQTEAVAQTLEDAVKRSKYIDVGKGVEIQMGISKEKLKSGLNALVESGEYEVHNLRIAQVTDKNNSTPVKVLTKKGVERAEIYKNMDKVRPVEEFAINGDARMFQQMERPKSIGWDRVHIRYAIPEGQKGHGTNDDGAMMDGAMFLRPGVKDLNLGKASYAQVRIAVGDTHYLKGMALYGTEEMFKNIPKGTDIIFNTNKTANKTPQEVLKELKKNPEGGAPIDGPNPFGATVKRQNTLVDSKGNPVYKPGVKDRFGNKVPQIGSINIVNEEGDWGSWSKALSAQFLSKQPTTVVHERLKATMKQVQDEYESIQKVTNPVIKKQLMESFVSDLESKQVHMKAAAPKGFQGHVILPVPDMKENEVYAPNYKNGEKVVLIRYPHGGRFEIPELTVNNNSVARKMISKDSPDAIGIHPKVASKMSGADFDGDTAYVIPNNKGKFKSRDSLKELKNFDPNMYADKPGTFTPITKRYQQTLMGVVSNLITDMTLQGAPSNEIARAVKHSMVVIDAEKHKLNYKRSAEENGIDALMKRYMTHVDKIKYGDLERYNPKTRRVDKVIDPDKLKKDLTPGKEYTSASTIISRHKQSVITDGYQVEVPDPKSKSGGTKMVWRNKKETYLVNMVKDANVFLGPNATKTEHHYADYINELKAFKNKVDSEMSGIKMPARDPKAAKIYAEEVLSMKDKVNQVKINRIKERQAQRMAEVSSKAEIARRSEDEVLKKDEISRIKQQALNKARSMVGAERTPVTITDDEWDAVQSNAVSGTLLKELVSFMDDSQLKSLATPRANKQMTDARKSKAKALLANGYTIAQVAEALGVSSSTIGKIKAE